MWVGQVCDSGQVAAAPASAAPADAPSAAAPAALEPVGGLVRLLLLGRLLRDASRLMPQELVALARRGPGATVHTTAGPDRALVSGP